MSTMSLSQRLRKKESNWLLRPRVLAQERAIKVIVPDTTKEIRSKMDELERQVKESINKESINKESINEASSSFKMLASKEPPAPPIIPEVNFTDMNTLLQKLLEKKDEPVEITLDIV